MFLKMQLECCQNFHGANAVDLYRVERRMHVGNFIDGYCEKPLYTVNQYYDLVWETGSSFNVSGYGYDDRVPYVMRGNH